VRQADSGGPVAVPLTGTAAPAMRPSRPTMTRACSGSGLVHLDRSPLLTRGPKGSVSGLIQERNMFQGAVRFEASHRQRPTWRSRMNILPRDEPRRRRVLGQYLGVAGGGWLAGILWLLYGAPLMAIVLLLPCTVLLIFIARAYRA